MIPLRILRCTLTFVIISATVGCSSSQISQTSGSHASAGAVADVKVNLSAKADQDMEGDYREHSVSNAVQKALLTELRRQGKFASQGLALDFTVTECRLRSGSSVFWLGVSGGGDHIGGTVTIKQGGKVVKAFEVSADGHDSMWSGVATGRLTVERRVDLFTRLLARDIAAKL